MKKNVLTIISAIILIILIFLFAKFNRFQWVKEGYKVVDSSVYDSLIAIAERPPVIVVDTLRDTIYIEAQVDTIYLKQEAKIIEKPEEITADRQGYIVEDTLRTEYFSVFLQDEVHADHIMRMWSSEVYKENYVTTIEKEKPVLVPDLRLKGLYGGASYYYLHHLGHMFTVDASLVVEQERIYSLYGGAVYVNNNNDILPIIGMGIKIKF